MITPPQPATCTFMVQDTGSPVQCIMDGVLYSAVQLVCGQSDGYYLIYIRTGKGSLRRQNSANLLFPGTIVFMDRTHPISIEVIQPPFSAACFLLSSEAADNAYLVYSGDGNPVFEISRFSNIPNLVSRLLELCRETSEDARALYARVSGELTACLTICKSPESENRFLPPRYILAMRQLLDTRFSESITLDTLSSDLHINKYKLAKEFKAYYSISPIEYLIKKRIEVACRLLLETQETVTQIGIAVAMENTPYFVSLFKRHKGITPLKFRIRNQSS